MARNIARSVGLHDGEGLDVTACLVILGKHGLILYSSSMACAVLADTKREPNVDSHLC